MPTNAHGACKSRCFVWSCSSGGNTKLVFFGENRASENDYIVLVAACWFSQRIRNFAQQREPMRSVGRRNSSHEGLPLGWSLALHCVASVCSGNVSLIFNHVIQSCMVILKEMRGIPRLVHACMPDVG